MTDNVIWATEAQHKLGDISRPSGDYAYVDREEDDHYVGAWVTGFGFVEVRFPKSGTRPLTPAEKKWHEDHPVVIV